MRTAINFVDTCYVLLQIDKIHPIAKHRHDLVWYPEVSRSLLECIQYQPYVKSIVTECPWIIACYDQEHMRIWNKEHGWIKPNNQTYGASVSSIMHHVLKIHQTIPAIALDGGTEIEKFIKQLKDERP